MLKINIVPKTYPRRAALFALPVLMALLLAACNGDNAAETEAPPQNTVVAVAATEAPPPADPTVPPPATEPTTAPAPAVEPTTMPEEGASLTAGDCDNPYFPVVEGRTYRYANEIPGLGASEYAQTYSAVADSSFTITIDAGDGDVFVQTWRCTGEGLLQPEFSQMPGGLEGVEIEFVEAEGVTVPTADVFEAGGEWTTHYVANATLPDMGAGAITMVQTVDLINTVAGIEAVSVPAGDYPAAVRIDTSGTINIAMSSGDTAAPATDVTLNYSSWYVAGVGLVRQEFSGLFGEADDVSVTELVAIEE